MAIVKKTPLAEEDFYTIWHFIAIEKQNPINADRFIRELDNALTKLALSPAIGTLKDKYVNGVYQFPFGNYLIFYFPIENGIEIVRVLHGARNLSDLF